MQHRSFPLLKVGALVALATASSLAHCQWTAQWWADDFNAHTPVPSPLAPQRGWQRYNNTQPNADVINTMGQRVMQASFMCDVVRPVANFSTGNYMFTADFFVPSTTARSFLALMNAYSVGGAQTWGSILRIDALSGSTSGTVTWLSSGTLHGTGSTPIGGGPGTVNVPWGWNKIRSEVNLSGNSVSTFINGQLIATHPWKAQTSHAGDIAAIHVAGWDAPSSILYDNMCLTPNIPRCYMRGLRDNFNTINTESATASTALQAAVNATFPGTWVGFDQSIANAGAASTIGGLPTNTWIKGNVSFRAKALSAPNPPFDLGSGDDLFYFWTPPGPPTSPTNAVWLYQNRYSFANGGSWPLNANNTFAYNLQAVPSFFAASNNKDLLAEINQKGTLSIFSRDDTALDYWRLCLWSCRPMWRNIQLMPEGNMYAYALPNGTLRLEPGVGAGPGSIRFDMQNSSAIGSKFAPDSAIMTPNKSYQWDLKARVGDSVGHVASAKASRVGNTLQMKVYGPNMANIGSRFRGYRNGRVITEGALAPGQSLTVTPGGGMVAETLSICETSFNTGCHPSGWTPNQPLAISYRPAAGLYRINGVDVSEIVMTVPVHTLGLATLGGVTEVTLTPQNFDGPVPTDLEIVAMGAWGLELGEIVCDGPCPDRPTQTNGPGAVVTTSTSTTGTGDSGVVVNTTAVGCAASATWFVPDEATLADGATLSLDMVGTRSDQTQGSIGTVNVAKNGAQRDITADFSALGSSLVTVQVWNGTNVVQTFNNVNPSQIGTILGNFPTGMQCSLFGNPLTIPNVNLSLGGTVTFVHNSTSYNATQITISPVGATLGASSINSLGVEGNDIGEVVLTDVNTCLPVAGRVAPEGFVGSLTGTMATIQIRCPITKEVVSTQVVPLDNDGNYNIVSEWFGEYELVVDARSFLKTATLVYLKPGLMTGVILGARNGDVNNSGEVDLTDIDIVIGQYLSSNPIGDVNGSGEVDLTDIDIVIGSYLMSDD